MKEKSIYKFKNKFYLSGNLSAALLIISFLLFAYYDDIRFLLINLISIFFAYFDRYSYSEIEFFEDNICIKRSNLTYIPYSNIKEIKYGKHKIILIEENNYTRNFSQTKYRKSSIITTEITHSYNNYIILPNTKKIYDLISTLIKIDIHDNDFFETDEIIVSHQNKIKYLELLSISCLYAIVIFVILYLFVGYCSKELLDKYNNNYSLMTLIYAIIVLLKYISLYRSTKIASLTTFNFHSTYLELANTSNINIINYSNIYKAVVHKTTGRRKTASDYMTITNFNSSSNKIEELKLDTMDAMKIIKITDLLQKYKTHSIQ